MPATFLIADTHFGHEKTCTTFLGNDGKPLRPFASADEMDEALVKNWNERVGQYDRVYLAGDVVINRRCLTTLSRLNGKLRLVAGNHDIFKTSDYLKYFEEIMACKVFEDMIVTHIPIHKASLTQRFGTNVHGHLHANRVKTTNKFGVEGIDPYYLCVSVEQIDFAPISLEEVRARIEKQRQELKNWL